MTTSGTISIAIGQTSVQVTGLNLSSVPPPPTVTVLAPTNPPDAIFAFPIGLPTTDGFVIGLSAPPSVAGYSIKWVIDVSGATPTSGTTGVAPGDATNPVPLLPFPWKDRSTLISGRMAINGNSFYLCVDPYGTTFFVYPEVDDNHTITINWDGIKNSFNANDLVPFDEECAGAVAEYVTAWMAKGAHDWSTWGAAMKPGIGSYYSKLRKLLLNSQNRTTMRDA